MFSDLTSPEQQRVARYYMAQMGGRSPADMAAVINQLNTRPELAARAMGMYNEAGGTSSDRASNVSTGPGSRITDALSALMAQDGTTVPPTAAAVSGPTTAAPLPPRRPVSVNAGAGTPRGERQDVNAPISLAQPPSRPADLQLAEPEAGSSLASIIAGVLGLGGTGKLAYDYLTRGRGAQPTGAPTPTPEAGRNPQVGGGELPATTTPRAAATAGATIAGPSAVDAMGNPTGAPVIEDAQYREVQPPKQIGNEGKVNRLMQEGDTPAQIEEQRKLTGPKEEDTRDNVKRATGETIKGEDETPEAGVRRTTSRGATTAKEKIKPRVKVKL
jgi:hypothetical protein